MFNHPMRPLVQPPWLPALSRNSPPFAPIAPIAHSEILAIAEKRIPEQLPQPRSRLITGRTRELSRLHPIHLTFYCFYF